MRIVVVDRHPVMRLGLVALLSIEDDVETVRVADSMCDALRIVTIEQPDIVVMDLQRGHQGGTDLCREIKAAAAPPGIVIYTDNNAEVDLFLCQLSGADSYVHKDEEPSRLLDAVRATHTGKRMWLIGGEGTSDTGRQVADGHYDCLTPRERQIFSFMLRRYTNAHIARELGISLQTVKNHSSRVLRKLGVNRRSDLPYDQAATSVGAVAHRALA